MSETSWLVIALATVVPLAAFSLLIAAGVISDELDKAGRIIVAWSVLALVGAVSIHTVIDEPGNLMTDYAPAILLLGPLAGLLFLCRNSSINP